MVAAFLRAEIESERYREDYVRLLDYYGWPRTLIDTANHEDRIENHRRGVVLGDWRGYPDKALFCRFPEEVRWSTATVTPAELAEFYYLDDVSWNRRSGFTRLVRQGAERARNEPENPRFKDVYGILATLRAGHEFVELICVAATAEGPHVVLEGNTRATLFVLEQATTEIRIILGVSPQMTSWAFYGPGSL